MLKIAEECIKSLNVKPEMILRNDATATAFRITISLPESRTYYKKDFTAVLNFVVHPITHTITAALWSDSLANVTHEPEKSQVIGLNEFLKQINCSDYIYIDEDNDIRVRMAVNDLKNSDGIEITLGLIKQMSKLANVVYTYMEQKSRFL